MENGEYQLGGQKVLLKDRRATLEDGTIAGSATPLIECLKNAVCFGISPKDAVTCAAFNPAKRLGLEQEYGSISDSRKADFLVLDEDFNLLQVFSSGICVKNSL